ncbi:MAG: PQQ-binding-like beta-propeller repeat protein [Armatimonadota bacterium]|nr:PQQ-binding-like beta-propeller repeat protein [Armatimonadota bacterium]
MVQRRHCLALTVICLFLSLSAVGHAKDWPFGRGDAASSGFTSEGVQMPLVLSWDYNTSRMGRNTSAPIVAGDVVYFCAGDRVMALDAQSGVLKWKFPADEPLSGAIKAAPAVSKDTLYFGATDGNLYAVNINDGVLRWTYPTRGSIRSAPIISDNVVYFGSDDNNLYAVNAETGEPAWRGPFATRDDVAASPVVSGGYVVFVSMDTIVYGTNSLSGAMRWQYRLPQVYARSAPVVAGDSVYVAAGNALHTLSLKSGRFRGSIPFSSEIAAGPTIANDVTSADSGAVGAGSTIYIITKNNRLYAITPAGKSKWSQYVNLPYACSSPPTVAGDTVVVGSERGSVSAYSAATGKLKWQYTILPAQLTASTLYTAVTAPPVVANKRLYLVTDDGSLHCFDSDMPDDTAPEAFDFIPRRATAMSGQPPIKISAVLFDLGCGINDSSIQLKVDDEVVPHTFDASKYTVSCETTDRKEDGRHNITLSVEDWRGNKHTDTWSFIVDNKLRPPVTAKPAAPPKTPRPTYKNNPLPPPKPPAPSSSGEDVSPPEPIVEAPAGT